jgi:signal transduction histidine kinase/ActR/RegA family two-component response regulator
MWQALKKGKTWVGPIVNKKKEGTFFQEESVISPVCDSEGKIVSYVSVRRDVTQEVAMQEQLRQAQKMESIGRLAGGVAHDFNNLLMVIRGYASLLMKRLPEEHPGHRMAAEVNKAVDRGAGLTRQLLAFGRKQVVQSRLLHLHEVIEETAKMMGQLLGENILVVQDFDTDLFPVLGDPVQIQQVLMNLALNARDAMPKGGTLTMETSRMKVPSVASADFGEVPEGNYAMLTVRDSGEGMSPEVQEHLFEPFFTTKDQGKGTGLGLAVVYGIVKQMGGHIVVRSQTGKGTSFRILFPEAPSPAVFPAGEKPLVQGKSSGGTETLLLVEDDEALRRVTTEMLRSEGYTVIHAAEAQEALRALREPHLEIRLMLSDVMMPGMQGTDLAEEALRLRPELKVILMSGYADQRALNRLLSRKGISFLAKPIPDDQLLHKLREVLDAGARKEK